MLRRLFGVIALALSGQVGAQVPATESGGEGQAGAAPTLEQLSRPQSRASTGVPDLRAQMLHDAAKTLGFRGGLASRTQELKGALEFREGPLAAIFQFAPLVSTSGTVPPVIVSAQDVAAFGTDQVRTGNQVYKIEREERFVSTPPSWRDYLLVGLPASPDIDMPELQARPQDEREQGIWSSAVVLGWSEGRRQADAILVSNFNRLTRDYTGMMTYSALLQQGFVTPTRVAVSRQTVTGDRRQITLGDTLHRVTSKAALETDQSKWRPTVRVGSQPTSEEPEGSVKAQ